MSDDGTDSLGRRQYDAGMTEINDSLKAIKADLHAITHGNGRPGIRQLGDDVYGPRNLSRIGLLSRMERVEDRVEALAAQRKETLWMQRGIAIAVSAMALDTVLGVDLMAMVGRAFGGG